MTHIISQSRMMSSSLTFAANVPGRLGGSLRPSRILCDRRSRCLMMSATESHVSRREALISIASSAIGLTMFGDAAHADRTGKYSTKLTAKRRYLPRITKDVAAFAALGPLISAESSGWQDKVNMFYSGEASDVKSAMPLFSTTYFSEGNKIGPMERKLKEIEDLFFAGIDNMKRASDEGNASQALVSFQRAAEAVNEYIVVAKLTDVVEEVEL